MSRSSGDGAQSPEHKSSSGFVNVFKSLTGTRSNKVPTLRAQASIAQHLNSPTPPKALLYAGQSEYEILYNQIKSDRPLQERVAAAEAITKLLPDGPVDGVCRSYNLAGSC